MSAVRPAAVAGMFYPGDARSLASEVDDLLGSVEHAAPRLGYPKALIVPHAGYIYSGGVAARAYDELAAARRSVRRVVLLGPTHRVAVRGLAAPSVEAFATPLGAVRIDREAIASVRELPQVVINDAAHALEHSLEVQLPFLQAVLGDFALVPFAVGSAGVEQVAEVLERLWGGPETLIVISTDLSHYHSYQQARAIDGATIERIARFATDIDHEEACGATPLNGLLSFSKQKNLSLKLLATCNSGDTAGGKDRVVGYSAFGLYEGGEVPLEDAGKALLQLAPKTARRIGDECAHCLEILVAFKDVHLVDNDDDLLAPISDRGEEGTLGLGEGPLSRRHKQDKVGAWDEVGRQPFVFANDCVGSRRIDDVDVFQQLRWCGNDADAARR